MVSVSPELNIRGHCELQRCDLWQRECVKGAGWVLQDWRGTYGELVSHIPPPYGGYCAVAAVLVTQLFEVMLG